MLIFHWNWMELGVPYSRTNPSWGSIFLWFSQQRGHCWHHRQASESRETWPWPFDRLCWPPQPIYDARALLRRKLVARKKNVKHQETLGTIKHGIINNTISLIGIMFHSFQKKVSVPWKSMINNFDNQWDIGRSKLIFPSSERTALVAGWGCVKYMSNSRFSAVRVKRAVSKA